MTCAAAAAAVRISLRCWAGVTPCSKRWAMRAPSTTITRRASLSIYSSAFDAAMGGAGGGGREAGATAATVGAADAAEAGAGAAGGGAIGTLTLTLP